MSKLSLDSQKNAQKNRAILSGSVAAGAGAGAAILSTVQPASAADAITELTTGVTAMGSIITAAQPIVIGVLIFSAATQVLKRLVYS